MTHCMVTSHSFWHLVRSQWLCRTPPAPTPVIGLKDTSTTAVTKEAQGEGAFKPLWLKGSVDDVLDQGRSRCCAVAQEIESTVPSSPPRGSKALWLVRVSSSQLAGTLQRRTLLWSIQLAMQVLPPGHWPDKGPFQLSSRMWETWKPSVKTP